MLQHSLGEAASKACWLTWFLHKTTKNPLCLWTRCASLSTQINIYCLITNQTPVFLVQCAHWMRAAVMLLQSLNFSAPPSYNPQCPPPWYILKSTWLPLTIRCTISRRSHGKIGDCEQSICFDKEKSKITSGYQFPIVKGSHSKGILIRLSSSCFML